MPTQIRLQNAGFEDLEQITGPIEVAGPFDFVTPPGWQVYDPNNLVPQDAGLATAFTGSWEPSANFFQTIPEGDQVSSIYLNRNSEGNSLAGQGKVGLEQTSHESIQANTTYTLSASILDTTGRDFGFFNGAPGYELQLFAGDRVLASTKSTTLLEDGEIKNDSVSFTASAHETFLGEKLGVRLINSNEDNGSNPEDGGNGLEVNFDNVELTAKPAKPADRLSSLGLSLAESQQPDSPAETDSTGSFDVTLSGNELRIDGSFEDLTSDLFFVGGADPIGTPESPIHVHIGESGTNGPIARNLTVTDFGNGSGTFTGQFTLSDEEVITAQADGFYINLHTQNNLGGELRGQIDLPPLSGEFGGVTGRLQEGTDRSDSLRGSREEDLLFGKGGKDILRGKAGDDRLYGGDSKDVLKGGKGDDKLYGEDGRDHLNGGSGNDILDGGKENDHLSGRSGNDILNGGAGKDWLLGGGGNDVLNGGAGKDFLFGGGGHDIFVLSKGQGKDIIFDFSKNSDLISLSGELSFGAGGNVSQVNNTLVYNQGSAGEETLAVLKGFHGTLDAANFA